MANKGKGCPDLERFVEANKKLARAWGPGSLPRASPTRAVPVLLDTCCGKLRWWALENSAIIRYSLQGYVDVRIHVVDPSSVTPEIAMVLRRWEDVRVRVAQANRSDVAKKLRGFEVVLKYKSYAHDACLNKLAVLFESVETHFFHRKATLRRRVVFRMDSKKNHPVSSKIYSPKESRFPDGIKIHPNPNL